LIIPLAVAVTLMWLAAGTAALLSSDDKVFIVASGPFSLICGYVFGISLVRRTNGNGHSDNP
jgi:hypothetical protein